MQDCMADLPGDLYIVLHVKPHSFFEREGKDLFCSVPISFAQAALGAEIMIPTLEGEHKLKIPEGTQSSTVFKLKGKGVPSVRGSGKGDLHVRGEGPNSHQTQQAPTRTAGRAERNIFHQQSARAPGAVRESERHLWVSSGTTTHGL